MMSGISAAGRLSGGARLPSLQPPPGKNPPPFATAPRPVVEYAPGERTPVKAGESQQPLPNIKSVVKDVKKSRERRLRNLAWRSKIKTFVKKTRQVIGSPEEAAMLKATSSVVDSAAQKGIIHKNAAARRKSRMMKRAAKTGKS